MTPIAKDHLTHSTVLPNQPASGLSMMDALGAVLKHRRLVVGVALATGILMGAFVLFRQRTYTASASFTPQPTKSQLGALGGLAAQFGVSGPSTDGNQSPAFYADLLRSRTVLEPLVELPVKFTWNGRNYRGSFASLSNARGSDSLQKLDAAVRKLRGAMTVAVTARTGIVQIETTTQYPALSAILTDSALGQLNSFNVQTRRSQAAAQRQFLEVRLASVSQQLQEAEDAVRDFAGRNRGDVRNSPELQVQQDRLSRTVSMRSEVFRNLAQALEQAKLDEIRDTPLITIIEQARIPVRPDPRRLVTTVLIAILIGFILGAVAALLRQAMARNREERPESFAELSAEFAAAKADIRRFAWPLKRGSVDVR